MNLSSDNLIGPAAGVATSVLWMLTSLFFTSAGKRIGSTKVNGFRLLIAVALHMTTFFLFTGAFWPQLTSEQALFLALSGILGLTICDQFLFTAFVEIGPRIALLVMTTSPLVSGLLGWVFLDESIGLWAAAGIGMTLGGVAWVVLERPATPRDRAAHHHAMRGLAFATLAAICQAGGMLLSKKGMGHTGAAEGAIAVAKVDPQAATLVRMVFGAAGMIPIFAVYAWRRGGESHTATKARRIGRPHVGYALAVGGAVVGPFLGVWMSLVAVDKTPLLGVAQTLVSLSPVMILPVSVFFLKEKVSPRATFGALLAVAGAAVLFLT